MEYLIGIDTGTTNVKAVLIDLDGNEVKVSSRDNETIQPGPAMVEQDMNLLWDNVLACLIEVSKGIDANRIKGIGLTGQGEGLWLIDKNGEPVDYAHLWNDGRATDVIEDLENMKVSEFIYKKTGTSQFPGTTLAHLLWTKKHNPKILDKSDKLFHCKDWIRYKLTKKVNIEVSDSATSLLDINTLEYSEELFEAVGLTEYKRLLPELIRSSDVAGTITDEIAELTGLNPNTPVGGGAIDVIAATVGVGAIRSGDTSTIIGTTCATTIVTDQIAPGTGTSRFEVHGIDGLYVNLQPTMSGTPNTDWVIKEISTKKDFKSLDIMVSELPPVPGGVLFHPYISTSGERSPFYNPNARSSFFGLSTLTLNEYMVKSVYEGVAFSIKDCLYDNPATEGTIFLAGGGAKSYAWAQIVADVTGRRVEITKGNEFAAKGAVGILAVKLGIFKDFEEMKDKMCHSRASFEPRQEFTDVYDKYFDLYRNMRISFTEHWNQRHEILVEIGEAGF